jgi:hypothetical protein
MMTAGERSRLRDEVIRTVIALQIEKGLDYESFLFGLHVGLTDPTLGGWIAATFDLDDESAIRLRHTNEQMAATIRWKLEQSGLGDY